MAGGLSGDEPSAIEITPLHITSRRQRPVDEVQPPSKWRARFGFLAGLVLLVPLVGWIPYGQWRLRNDVEIEFDSSSLLCSGTTVDEVSDTFDREVRFPVIAAAPDMDCQLQFSIVNRGRWPVNIDEIVMPALGSEGREPIEATELSSNFGAGVGVERREGTAAAWPVDHEIEGGQQVEYQIRLVFRADGCGDPQGYVSDQFPSVTVSVWRMTRTVQPSEATLGIGGSDRTVCGR